MKKKMPPSPPRGKRSNLPVRRAIVALQAPGRFISNHHRIQQQQQRLPLRLPPPLQLPALEAEEEETTEEEGDGVYRAASPDSYWRRVKAVDCGEEAVADVCRRLNEERRQVGRLRRLLIRVWEEVDEGTRERLCRSVEGLRDEVRQQSGVMRREEMRAKYAALLREQRLLIVRLNAFEARRLQH